MMICVFGILAAVFGSTAKAVPVNPANWHWSLVTYGNRYDDGPLSPPVDPGYPQYDYSWQQTHESGPWPALQVLSQWHDIWDNILPSDKSGSGTLGPLPWVDELILHISSPEITADILVSADENGYGTISIANITFGQVQYGGWFYNVTGARFQGDVTIEGVPEPATICLLGLGSLVLLRRRRSTAL